ncbi:MAG: hypothetical protein Kow0058_00970 [Roseovarius sp.]
MRRGEGAASFVARIWLERHRNGAPVWRGHIQHVQSGEERHFRRLAEMCAFMERLTEERCDGLWDQKPNDIELQP